METEIKSTKEKGAELEREFAEYMKTELGYSDCYLNQKVKGKISTNEYEVDIVGRKMSEEARKRHNNGLFIALAGLVLVVFGLTGIMQMDNSTLMIIGGVVVIGGFIFEQSKKNLMIYTWVECKHYKTKIGKNIVNELNYKVNDYNQSNDKEYDFTEKFLVSGSGFITNSFRFAKEHSIDCFERVGNMEFNKIDLNEIL